MHGSYFISVNFYCTNFQVSLEGPSQEIVPSLITGIRDTICKTLLLFHFGEAISSMDVISSFMTPFVPLNTGENTYR